MVNDETRATQLCTYDNYNSIVIIIYEYYEYEINK